MILKIVLVVFKLALIFLPLILAAPPDTVAQWGPRGCPPVGGSSVVMAGNVYRWEDHTATLGQWTLWRDGVQAGGWLVETGAYYPRLRAGVYGPACDPPIPLPAGVGAKAPEAGRVIEQNFGVDRSQMGGNESYSINGKTVTKSQAIEAMQGGEIPVDCKRPFLTVIGPADVCERVRHDLESAPALAELRDQWRFHCYRPDEAFPLKDRDGAATFRTDGKPTVYMQSVDGRVIGRMDDYDGPERLAKALRKARDYDASRDKDPRNDTPLAAGGVPGWAWIAGLVGAAGAALFLFPRKEHDDH